jgi:hypothetical protein
MSSTLFIYDTNSIMQLVSTTVNHDILPVPTVYPVGHVQYRYDEMGVQITRYIHSVMGNVVYPTMAHDGKLVVLRRLALAFDALWRIPLPTRLIGKLRAQTNDGIKLSVGPDRHYSLGGPFHSVVDYLHASVRASTNTKLDTFNLSLTLWKNGMQNIPNIVEEIPIVVTHSDMGLHNIILSETNPTEVKAIIDWEFYASVPYAVSFYPIIEGFFCKPAPNCFGLKYPRADELRNTFWETIPEWQAWNQSDTTTVFLEWFQFVKFMKAEYRPDDLSDEE